MRQVGGTPETGADERPLPEELVAWRALLRAHARLVRVLEAELDAAHQIPLLTYDVLLQLAEVPERRLRMTELAERVLLSRSGLTRLVDRLERDGLVSRQPCPNDARGLYAALTDVGLDRLRAASHVHVRGINEHFVRRYDKRELARLRQLLGSVAD